MIRLQTCRVRVKEHEGADKGHTRGSNVALAITNGSEALDSPWEQDSR